MKVCPTCNETYKDDDINFCLADGTTLLKKRQGKAVKHSHWNDVLAIIVAALALLVLLCLVTSSPNDRSFISTGNGSPTHNWIGPVGANIAAVLISGFGWTAYLFPILISLIAWRVFQANTLIPSALRVAGFVFFAVSLAGLSSLFGGYQGGAIIGESVSQGSAYFIGRIGAGILLSAIFACSVLLITNFTLAGFQSHFEVAWENLHIRYDEWRGKRRAGRSDEISAAQARALKRKGKRDLAEDAVPPTIAVGDMEAMEAAVGRSTPLFEHEQLDSIPTIDTSEESYETRKVIEPENGEILIKPRDRTNDLDDGPTIEAEDVVVEPLKAVAVQNYDNYKLPDSSLLTEVPKPLTHKESELREIATLLAKKTTEFNVPGKVMHIAPGPVVTTFEFKPDAGVKYSRVTSLVDDLCLALKAPSIRIDRIPGKAYVGIEVPNQKREVIFLREVVESDKFKKSESLLTLGLGKTIDGTKYVADLAKMPHLLIAGATGAGKSVGVNTLVMSILYKARPDEVKFIMVDPKRLELGLYEDIPHLLHPIIVEPKKAATALKSMVVEMERRYKILALKSVRNIDGYNVRLRQLNKDKEWDENGNPHRILPYIVIIIDELADLMMVSGKEVEESITRLAQMARAVGIHLVLATQRPSVDVITGLIKANFPARISFRVSSKVDSRTIIDANGAEGLLGSGDMLFLPPGQSNVTRVHGAFVDEKEIKRVVDHVKSQGQPEYDTTITQTQEELDDSGDLPGRRDPLFNDALHCVVQAKRGSTSLLQRHLRIGYGRAAAILDAMVRDGYIGEMEGSTKARPVLARAYEDVQDLSEMENESLAKAMKVCPTCNEIYKDDDINFCLADGTTLLKKRNGKTAKHSIWNDAFAVFIVAVAVLVFLCIVTSSPDDRLLISTGDGLSSTRNGIDVLRANIAAFVISAFGWTAYMLPVLIALIAWRVVQSNTLIPSALRVAGFVFLAISLAGLTSLFGGYQGGAIVGEAALQGTAYFIGRIGAGILLGAIFACSVLLVTNFTLVGFLSHFDIAWDNLRIRIDESRSDEILAAKTRVEKRREKRISVENDSLQIIPTITVEDFFARISAGTDLLQVTPTIEDFRGSTPELSDEEIAEKKWHEWNRERIFELKGHVLDKVRSASSTDGHIDIDSMDGLDFEHFIAELLNQRGYHAEVTKGSGDMGVDILATNHDKRFAVQVKRYNQPISRRAISDAVTGKNYYGCDGAMVITNNYFTKDAQTLAAASDCILVDRDELFLWMSRDTADIATFQARLQEEIRNLQNSTTFAFWGEDVVFEASRELTVDYRLDFKESSFKKFSEVKTWLDPQSNPDSVYQLPQPSLITQNSGSGSFRALIESKGFQGAYLSTTVGFGESRDGSMVTVSLAELGHVFIAGSTEGRKPAGLQTMLTSLLFKASPKDIVITTLGTSSLSSDFREILNEGRDLSRLINEIDKRQERLTKLRVKDFREYNLEAVRRKRCERTTYYDDKLWIEFHSIILIIDDFAETQVRIDDLLKDIVQRGSGVGVHLVLATLRPTPATIRRVNSLGIPTKIVSHVPAPFDSRGILAKEPLSPTGQNEMLIRLAGSSDIVSVFEPRLAYEDLSSVLDHVREQGFRRSLEVEWEELDDSGDLLGRRDPQFHDALKCVVQAKRGSTSLLQRHLRIGYGRAAAILDAMVREGYIGEMDGSSRARPVLPKAYEDLQDISEMENEQ